MHPTIPSPPDPVISALNLELSQLKQDLLDLQVQTKTSQKVLQSQILSLEEDNTFLKGQVRSLCDQLCQLGKHDSPGSHGKRQQHQSHQQLSHSHPTGHNPPQKSTRTPCATTPCATSDQSSLPIQTSFRIIWGTHKSCSLEEVRGVLSGLLDGSKTPSVHRSFKRLGRGMAWWFTITCDEQTILSLESKWGSSNSNSGWVLLKSLKDRPPSKTSTHSLQGCTGNPTSLQDPPSATPTSHVNAPTASSARSSGTPPPSFNTPSQESTTATNSFLILWGTPRTTTVEGIKELLSSCGQESVTVKHTVRNSRWWFTLIAGESVIKEIETNWVHIRPSQKWSLLRSLSNRSRALSNTTVSPAADRIRATQTVNHSLRACPSSTHPSDAVQCPNEPIPDTCHVPPHPCEEPPMLPTSASSEPHSHLSDEAKIRSPQGYPFPHFLWVGSQHSPDPPSHLAYLPGYSQMPLQTAGLPVGHLNKCRSKWLLHFSYHKCPTLCPRHFGRCHTITQQIQSQPLTPRCSHPNPSRCYINF